MFVAIVQARMMSTRLPGKVMLDLCGRPVLWHVIQRVRKSKYISRVIVATSDEKSNNLIREYCYNNKISVYSGSETDVLNRFYEAALSENITLLDSIVRITADCPLIDHEVIDLVIEAHENMMADYTANVIAPTYPDGLDCEVFKFSSLAKANDLATKKSDREHVTLFIRNNPQLFSCNNVSSYPDLSSLRWTLDTKDDYEFISFVYKELYPANVDFNMHDVLRLIEKYPDLSKINNMYQRNEGLNKSLAEDGVDFE